MNKKEGVVNVFETPYEAWTIRKITPEEASGLIKNKRVSPVGALHVKDKLIEMVSTPVQAASRMLREHTDIAMERHIDNALEASEKFRQLRSLMPADVPKALHMYQEDFSQHNSFDADNTIKIHGVEIADGQFLFHGGLWSGDATKITTLRPFSTSFCPQVALRNAEWRGKAYDAGRIDLMVICVRDSKTKAYFYSLEGNHGNEKEVVFSSGAVLTRISETHIADVSVSKMDSNFRTISKIAPAYVVEIELN